MFVRPIHCIRPTPFSRSSDERGFAFVEGPKRKQSALNAGCLNMGAGP